MDFVSIPPQYIPVEEFDTESAALVQRGFTLESVQWHTLASNFLSIVLKNESDKRILHRGTLPREAWDPLLAWYSP